MLRSTCCVDSPHDMLPSCIALASGIGHTFMGLRGKVLNPVVTVVKASGMGECSIEGSINGDVVVKWASQACAVVDFC